MRKVYSSMESNYYIRGNKIYDRYPIFRTEWGGEGVQQVATIVFYKSSKNQDNDYFKALTETEVRDVVFCEQYKKNGNKISGRDLIYLGNLVESYSNKLKQDVNDKYKNELTND